MDRKPAEVVPFPPAVPAPELTVPQKIFEFWKWMVEQPRARPTRERIAKIQARLNEGYSTEDICCAIVGCCSRPWNRGDNPDGTQYCDLELICRKGSKLEFYLNYAKEGAYEATIETYVRDTGRSRP